jgi:hypothetical protein
MSTYQGKPVTVVRDAKQGDPGWDATKDMVIIQIAGNTQSTVLRADVSPVPAHS